MNSQNKSAIDFMPISEAELKILSARADLLAHAQAEKISPISTSNYIQFRLDKDNLFGITYDYIKEIIENYSITPVPMIANCIVGVTNYRGYLLPIINLNTIFDIKRHESDNRNYIIVISVKNISLGILASYIDGSKSFENNSLDSPLLVESKIKQEYIQGLHKGITAILNVEKIVAYCFTQLNI
jgi:purine-binding chemotaxis protein CheW